MSDKPTKRDLDAIFGEVLPESTSDDRDANPDEDAHGDDWWHQQRPPHHGD